MSPRPGMAVGAVPPAWQPSTVPSSSAVPPRSSTRFRVAVVGLAAGALIGGGAGAGAVALTGGTGAAITASADDGVVIDGVTTATDVSAAAAKASPSVVTVYVTTESGGGSGSGVVLTEDGYVLTNNHVVSLPGGAGSVQVRTADGGLYEASVVGTEPSMDLAVLKLTDAPNLTPAAFADSDDVQVGDLAVAIGAPLGLSETVTDGIISATHRPVTTDQTDGETTVIDALQTDAAINPGNSGGALVNAAGEVVGINTAIATVPGGPGGQASSGNIGVGFAIPSNTAKRIADEIVESGTATIAFLGVSARTASADGSAVGTGAQVAQVQPGTPADRAGLRSGDVVTAIGDRNIASSAELTAAVRSTEPGDEMTLTIQRGNQTAQVEVLLSDASV